MDIQRTEDAIQSYMNIILLIFMQHGLRTQTPDCIQPEASSTLDQEYKGIQRNTIKTT